MLPSVQLDRQLPLGAREINNALPDRMLAAKFPPVQPMTKREPQDALHIRRLLTQTTR